MSRGISARNAKRSEMLHTIGNLGRQSSTQTAFLHELIAQSVGLNATDTRCLSLIRFHPDGMVTAGWLSDMTGLTTGAITHIVDRLEARGVIERVRDAEDRRKVYIRLRPENLAPLQAQYEALGESYMSVLDGYSDSELTLIQGYMEKMSQMTEQLMKRVIAGRVDQALNGK